jgi:hypothetical protein
MDHFRNPKLFCAMVGDSSDEVDSAGDDDVESTAGALSIAVIEDAIIALLGEEYRGKFLIGEWYVYNLDMKSKIRRDKTKGYSARHMACVCDAAASCEPREAKAPGPSSVVGWCSCARSRCRCGCGLCPLAATGPVGPASWWLLINYNYSFLFLHSSYCVMPRMRIIGCVLRAACRVFGVSAAASGMLE